ncbi:MAG: acyltransferase family protein, partial [Rubrivivax sp.]
PAYAATFAFGVLLARRRVLLQHLEDLRWPALALGLAGWCVLVFYPGLVSGWPAVPDTWRLPLRLAFGAAQWGGVVAAFGFARRHLNFDHPWRAPLNEAVFPLYLVHQTLIIGTAVALRPLALPAGIEAVVIVMLSFSGGFMAWRLGRQVVGLRLWMGLSARQPEPALQRAAAAPSV